MPRVSFRTASGKRISFQTKKRNPRKRNAKRRNVKKRKKVKKVKKRKKAKKAKKRSACRTVTFKKPKRKKVKFCKGAGKGKAAKKRRAKRVLKAYQFVKGKSVSVPTGKRNGDIFTKGGKKYRAISYVSSTGKRVRYGLRVKASAKK